MTRLELYDTVVLKENKTLYGIVDRTHYETYEHLDDCLIIAHTQVDQEDLASFIRSGIPPKGHVFVVLADVSQGSVLVKEDQVELLDRAFILGDFVKQPGNSMLGTIIDFQETYVLNPVWKLCHLNDSGDCAVSATDNPSYRLMHTCNDACPVPVLPHKPNALLCDLIPNVPGEELKKATDLTEGDLVILDEWLGIVEEEEKDVILLLEDFSIVVVQSPDELYIPIPDFGDKPLVSIPEYDPDIPRPDVVVAQRGWSATTPVAPDEYHSGRLVITNNRNLRTGRWLRGHWHKDIIPQGRIIDSRSSNTFVRWLACNPFSSTFNHNVSQPHSYVLLYENINTFSNSAELRRNKKLAFVDPRRLPTECEDRRRKMLSPPLQLNTHVKTPTDIQIGDQVKFRDQAGAALKYQGTQTSDGIAHGQFERISPWAQSQVQGFDVNVLTVVSSQQEVTVRWQDGSVSKQKSTTLHKFDLFESDLTPADLVASREGLRQRLVASPTQPDETDWASYNEISVLERPHELKPSKVGVVQSVDPQERVAKVRWFINSSVRILGNGNVLSRDSRFGLLSEKIEDVSLYEVLSFPALTKHLKDMVMLAPKSPSVLGLDAVTRCIPFVEQEPGMTAISMTSTKDRLRVTRGAAAGINAAESYSSPVDTSLYRSHLSLDWIGEIVGVGINGMLTVRVGWNDFVKDIIIEHDQIIAIVDENALSDEGMISDSDSMELDNEYPDSLMGMSDAVSTISETVEYEGGRRIDDDSDDGNWEDEDSVDDRQDVSRDTEIVDHYAEVKTNPEYETSWAATEPHSYSRPKIESNSNAAVPPSVDIEQMTIPKLTESLPTIQPLSFAVLELQPPADQHQASSDLPGDSPNFTKRMMREHKILANALPRGQIYVRTYESRLDLMRCLIVGPADTPYEFAPFVFDLQFTSRYPKEPPIAHFHSWTTGLGRVNPNLYEEGKICLSLLGTWQGNNTSESWTDKATVLQLLVSLQGLVFVRQPFYNEAGYEAAGAEDAYPIESLRYNEKSFIMTRAFVNHALSNVVGGLEDILAWTYLSPRKPYSQSLQRQHNKEDYRNDNNNVDARFKILKEISPCLLKVILDRSQNLIQISEQEKKTLMGNVNDMKDPEAGIEDEISGAKHQELIDGAGGSRGNPTKAFLKPLSKGAIVMLTKTVNALGKILNEVSDFYQS